MKLYTSSPTLDGDMRDVEAELDRQYMMSASPNPGEVRRLERRRRHIKSRYGFDYTVPANWCVAALGCAAMAGLLVLLSALN